MAKVSSKKNPSKSQQIQQIRQGEVIASVSGLNMDGVAAQLARTQVEVQKKLAEVSLSMTENLATLHNVESAIAARQAELQQLHQIDAAAITLDELEGKITQTREDWEREQDEHAAKVAEERDSLVRTRQREEEEYTYAQGQSRRQTESAFSDAINQRLREEELRKESLARDWDRREAELKSREAELAELKAKVDGFDARLKAEIAREVAVVTASLKRTYETDAALKAKDAETNLKLANQETLGARSEISRLSQAMVDLRAQLSEANRAAQEVATQALNASSGRAALETLQRSMDQQAQGGQAGGRR